MRKHIFGRLSEKTTLNHNIYLWPHVFVLLHQRFAPVHTFLLPAGILKYIDNENAYLVEAILMVQKLISDDLHFLKQQRDL